MRNRYSLGMGEFILGALAGAALAIIYSQNKESIDNTVKDTINKTNESLRTGVETAKGRTSEILSESGKKVSEYGSRLAETIDRKADEMSEKADEMSNQVKNNGRKKQNGSNG